jgi:serine protease AprX
MNDVDPTDDPQVVLPNTSWPAAINLAGAWGRANGAGVTVALLDTGVVPSPDFGGRVVESVDFTSDRDGIDRFGHGTHMGGIIAGDGSLSVGQWSGVAPGADLVSLKVARADGSTDVSVVLAALQWIVANRDRLHIRVLNLSFGTDGQQSYAVDPLDYAVERVWNDGIVVVVAAGNRGPAPGTIDKPADDPYVVTVGSASAAGVDPALFSSTGPTQDGIQKPDLLAPGVGVVSLRATGSTLDALYPGARVGDAYFKGSGTSQAAAIVSGIAALMLGADPSLTPDEVKGALLATAQQTSGVPLVDAGAAVDAAAAVDQPPPANGGLTFSSGLGLLEAARGSVHVARLVDGLTVPVVGELDVLGQPWDPNAWTANWSSALFWDPVFWSGASWAPWDAKTWSAKTWSTDTWN